MDSLAVLTRDEQSLNSANVMAVRPERYAMKKQKEINENGSVEISRRRFLGGAAATTVALTIVPRHVLGGAGSTAPSEKLNIAGVGVGGIGRHNLARMAQLAQTEEMKYLPVDENKSEVNVVALCDVDFNFAAETFKLFPKAKRYKDFRKMLEKQKDIDAVLVATPDHTHAVIAMMAMKMGKHVYVQKPLAHSVYEARILTEAAREAGIATQMGNQGHSGEGIRLIREWIQAGAIGPVREVHTWTDRPVWPQGLDMKRPDDTPPVPDTLDWDLWIGPAPYRPYHPAYHPFSWRAWWDFGTGALGDIACHSMDPAFWALDLKYPVSVEANTSTYSKDWKLINLGEVYPRSSIVRYTFPARGSMPQVKLTWYDGGLMPPIPDVLEQGRRLGNGGNLFIGDKGIIMSSGNGSNMRLIPESAMNAFERPPKTIERIKNGPEGHEQNWIEACKGSKPAGSNFEYSGPLSESVLVGNLAIRYPNRKLLWDGGKMEVINFPEANEYVRRQYRQGWSL